MLRITDTISLNESELQITFIQASGPGGQNVNKVATACQLRFDVAGSSSLPDDVRERLLKLAGRRATADGIIVLDARRHRTQHRNRQDAIERLVALIVRATLKPRPRKSTRPTKASQKKRLENKKRLSRLKRSRSSPGERED